MKNQETNNTQISGWFIPFTEDEIRDVCESLESMGYKPGGEGLREYVLDSMFSEEQPQGGPEKKESTVGAAIADFLRENPDVVGMYAQYGRVALQGLAGALLHKIKTARR